MFNPFKVMFIVGLCFVLFANTITFVLFTLSYNVLTLNHISNFSSKLLTTPAVSRLFLTEEQMLVSSANRIILSKCDNSHMSFITK